MRNSELFVCQEESSFYSYCLEILVMNCCNEPTAIIEFGSGNGRPVIDAILRSRFSYPIYGFEINETACSIAHSLIEENQLSAQYEISNCCFFESNCRPPANFLVGNPPYLPAPDKHILLPELYGGPDGCVVIKKLLSLDYENILLLIPSYSDPVGVLECAKHNNYIIPKFLITPMQFGCYSSQPKVRKAISELRKKNMAFYSPNIYLLAGVLFQKRRAFSVDLSFEVTQLMKSLQ